MLKILKYHYKIPASFSIFITNTRHLMGVTLLYRGQLNRPEDIPAITTELEDICRSAKWKYRIYDDSNDELRKLPFRGISFQPHPESENVWMLFLKDGKLFFPLAGEPNKDKGDWSFTKTQFAGADVHIALCRLFRYLSERWFGSFEVYDDGGYWEKEDSKLLHQRINMINNAISIIKERFSNLPLKGDESAELRINKILEALRNKRKL